MGYHDTLLPGDIHVLQQFVFANPSDRAAGIDMYLGPVTFTTANIGQAARQVSDGSFWLLIGVSPAVWILLGGSLTLHLTTKDKRLPALATVADGDSAIASAISTTPVNDGYVMVSVNGHRVTVANGLLSPGACYFSGDGGITKRLIADIVVGDTLHWVGSVAGYQLATSDLIDLDYEEL
jgi:hypothetical protein